MKKIFFTIFCAILLLPLHSNAQAYAGSIDFNSTGAEIRNGRLYLDVTADMSNLQLGKQEMVTLTPEIRTLDRGRSVQFAPVTIVGKTRMKILERQRRLDGIDPLRNSSQVVTYNKNGVSPVVFRLETAYEPWMRQAELVFNEETCGCVGAGIVETQQRAIERILPPVYSPVYSVAYVEPPTEEIKQRSETFAARLNYHVNKYEIVRNYMNNAAVLDEVDKIITEIKGDQNLTVNEFKVTGYASPEGGADHNMKLSENRAKAFVGYVQNRHNFSASAMQVDWKGDDWDGLKKLMEESNFSAKSEVLNILNNTYDIQERKNKLRGLSAYQALLNDYYPYLRRNEYTIAYVARAFSVEEAKGVFRTKPQQLSLNEMYLVANTYPKNSQEFKNIFDVAVRLFPEDPYANVNSGALDIENGSYDVALERSMKANVPEAWNNIGCIYVHKKDYTRAAQYFKRAADAGLSTAAQNLRELNQWLENPE